MPMSNSNPKPTRKKPDKPYPGYPMFPHPSGQWAKKIKGKLRYFGVWADPDAALERLNAEFVALNRGEQPPEFDRDSVTLHQICNAFLEDKEDRLNARDPDLSARTFRNYFMTAEDLLKFFGKDRRAGSLTPNDFRSYRKKLAKQYSVSSLREAMNRVRMIFKFGYEDELLPNPVKFGKGFNLPTVKSIRQNRNAAGEKFLEAEEIRRVLDACDAPMRAMTLLAVNTGYGNTDVGSLPKEAIRDGWAVFPRQKTAVKRRCPLWPETLEALEKAIAVRPSPVDPADDRLIFLTRTGRPWVRVNPLKEGAKVAFFSDNVSARFGKLLKDIGINGRRGLNFYALRHVFETIGAESKDQVAVDFLMGHAPRSDDMSAVYRERISDERLLAVVGVVRDWLFPEGGVQ